MSVDRRMDELQSYLAAAWACSSTPSLTRLSSLLLVPLAAAIPAVVSVGSAPGAAIPDQMRFALRTGVDLEILALVVVVAVSLLVTVATFGPADRRV